MRVLNKTLITKGRCLRFAVSVWLFVGAMQVVNAAALAVGPAIGDQAPDFEVTTLSGETFKLSAYKGEKPVYLKFWATWCSYCKVEMPHLQSIHDKYAAEVEVLTINVGINDSIINIEQFFNGGGFNLPTVFDQRGDLVSAYGIVGTPHHVLINKEGEIVYRTFLASDTLGAIVADWAAVGAEKVSQKNVQTMKRKQWKR
jgi:thiol-disulfide isomerase/thioredoxin